MRQVMGTGKPSDFAGRKYPQNRELTGEMAVRRREGSVITSNNIWDDSDETRTIPATIQLSLGHKSIQHTVRYTELASTRFKSLFWD